MSIGLIETWFGPIEVSIGVLEPSGRTNRSTWLRKRSMDQAPGSVGRLRRSFDRPNRSVLTGQSKFRSVLSKFRLVQSKLRSDRSLKREGHTGPGEQPCRAGEAGRGHRCTLVR